jgi:hypothetical protein
LNDLDFCGDFFKTVSGEPLNNFTHLFERQGCETIEQLGGNCIYKVRQVFDFCKSSQMFVQAIVPENSFHHACVLACNDELYFFDPCLTQSIPLSLNELYSQELVVCKSVFDFALGESFVCVENSDLKDFLNVLWVVPNKNERVYWNNLYDLKACSSQLIKPYETYDFKPRPQRLYLRFFNKNLACLQTISYFIHSSEFCVGESFYDLDNRESITQDFKRDFALSTGCSFADFASEIKRAADLI